MPSLVKDCSGTLARLVSVSDEHIESLIIYVIENTFRLFNGLL